VRGAGALWGRPALWGLGGGRAGRSWAVWWGRARATLGWARHCAAQCAWQLRAARRAKRLSRGLAPFQRLPSPRFDMNGWRRRLTPSTPPIPLLPPSLPGGRPPAVCGGQRRRHGGPAGARGGRQGRQKGKVVTASFLWVSKARRGGRGARAGGGRRIQRLGGWSADRSWPAWTAIGDRRRLRVGQPAAPQGQARRTGLQLDAGTWGRAWPSRPPIRLAWASTAAAAQAHGAIGRRWAGRPARRLLPLACGDGGVCSRGEPTLENSSPPGLHWRRRRVKRARLHTPGNEQRRCPPL
jgi:hypothetical protein